MRISTFAVLSAAGMAATSLAVWSTTGKAERVATSAPVAPAPPEAPAPGPDRSHFVDGGTLMLQARLGHPVLPAGADSATFLHVDINADRKGAAVVPAAAALVIAIDKSGSMKGQRLTNALAAARMAVRRMRDGDVVAVVTYDTATTVVVRPTRVDAVSREQIVARIGGIRAAGDTCISCGIDLAMHLLGGESAPVRRILLLSDGQPTAGLRDPASFAAQAERCRDMGVAVTAVGVNLDYNERVMAALARGSNGGHYFVADPAGLPAVFDREADSLARTVASGAELTVDLSPGVVIEQVFDRAFTQRGSRLTVPIGAVAAGDQRTVLMQLRVPAGPAGDRPVAAVNLRYDDLAQGRAGSCGGELVARLTGAPAELSPLDGAVAERLSRSGTAAALENANQHFREGRPEEARQVIAARRDQLKGEAAAAQPAAKPADKPAVAGGFKAQEEILVGSEEGFSRPPSPAAPEPGPTQVKVNQEDALKLAH